MARVCVIGSFNVDHVWRVPALPQAGATLAGRYATGPGGKPTASGGSATELGRRYLAHQTLMMMQQQTFNTYMWSRGFPGWTPMGKMW